MEAFRSNFKTIQNKLFTLLLIGSIVYLGLTEGYIPPRSVSQEAWEKVTPYLLPEDHEAKAALDAIFFSSRAILSIKSMKQAGFIGPKPRKWTHVIVCTHPDLPGYIIKTYLDSQRYFNKIPEYEHWLKRIQGVKLIEQQISKHNWESNFKTPKKWIYPLPENPSPPKEFDRKNFILIEEDMNLVDKQTNKDTWLSDLITTDLLENFYTLLEEVGLHDCAKPDNAPFSEDGRIAFIDTEDHDNWPVTYSKLTPFLSSEMKIYWKRLTEQTRRKDISLNIAY
ncbi:MAG TPA: hypothetical protein VIH61_00480 [Waddliaceae bacterium]